MRSSSDRRVSTVAANRSKSDGDMRRIGSSAALLDLEGHHRPDRGDGRRARRAGEERHLADDIALAEGGDGLRSPGDADIDGAAGR